MCGSLPRWLVCVSCLILVNCRSDREPERPVSDVYYGAGTNDLNCKNTFRPSGKSIDPKAFFARKTTLIFRKALIYAESRLPNGEVESSLMGKLSYDLEPSILCMDTSRTPDQTYFAVGYVPLVRGHSGFQITRTVEMDFPVQGANMPPFKPSVGDTSSENSLAEFFYARQGGDWSGAALFEDGKSIWLTSHSTFSTSESKRRFDFQAIQYELSE